MLPELSVLLRYRNEKVLNRYTANYPSNALSSHDAFSELMKYFWLSLKHDKEKKQYPNNNDLDFICGIHVEMSEIDDMWHTFLLFTKDYMLFCEEHFGKYFHHTPTHENERQRMDNFEIDFRKFLSYVYDNLGEESCLAWFGKLLS